MGLRTQGVKYDVMADKKHTTRPVRQKSAMDKLLSSMDELVDSAAKKKSAEELHQTRRQVNETIDRVVASRERRQRETA